MKIICVFGILLAAAPQAVMHSPSDSAIKSQNRCDALSDVARIDLSSSQSLWLEPGIRLTSSGGHFALGSYDGKRIQVETTAGKFNFSSPCQLSIEDGKLQLNGSPFTRDSIVAVRVDVQDDTDSNLKSMQESAKKLKAKNNGNQDNGQPNKKLRVRWLYGENPNPTAELFNSAAIQQLAHTSPIGF